MLACRACGELVLFRERSRAAGWLRPKLRCKLCFRPCHSTHAESHRPILHLCVALLSAALRPFHSPLLSNQIKDASTGLGPKAMLARRETGVTNTGTSVQPGAGFTTFSASRCADPPPGPDPYQWLVPGGRSASPPAGAEQSPARRQPHGLGTPTTPGHGLRPRASQSGARSGSAPKPAQPMGRPRASPPAPPQNPLTATGGGTGGRFRRAGARRGWSGTSAHTSCHRSGSLSEPLSPGSGARPHLRPAAHALREKLANSAPRADGHVTLSRGVAARPRPIAARLGPALPAPAQWALRVSALESSPRPDLRPRSRNGAVLRVEPLPPAANTGSRRLQE